MSSTLEPFALERYFARHEFSARYLLGSSDPESLSVRELLALEPEAEARLLQLRLGYTESSGARSLRLEIARTYQRIGEDEVLVHVGAEEALYALFQALLRPGDELVVHAPSYASHQNVPRALGVTVRPWRGRLEDGFRPSLDELETLVGPRTRAILICSPHNPTGYHFTSSEQARIVSLASKHGLHLICDEVYRGSEDEPSLRLPAGCELYERAVSLGALSKVHGLPGLRVGWIATRDRQLLSAVAAYKDYLSIANPAPSELLAEVALRHSEALFARTVARLRRNRARLGAFLREHARWFEAYDTHAGTMLYPRLRHGGAKALCDEVLQARGVMLVPSTLFDDGDANVRIGFGRADFDEALGELGAYLVAQAAL